MALTFTRDDANSPSAKSIRATMPGNRVEWVGTVQFDASYPTAGELVDLADLDEEVDAKSGSLDSIVESMSSDGLNKLQLTVATGKLKVYVAATSAEVANTTDLSGAGGLFPFHAFMSY